MEESYPVRTPDIVVRKEKKEALLFNPSDGSLLCINKTGIFIWDLCDGSCTVKDIGEKVMETYEVSIGKAEEDCKSYLKEMESAGFIGYKV